MTAPHNAYGPGGSASTIEDADIQATVLRPRPTPYKGQYVVLRIGEAAQGREMLKRLIPHVASAEASWVPEFGGWLGVAFTYAGLNALGLPRSSLESFPSSFRQGMANRAAVLNDVGGNDPANWEYPFGTNDAHVLIAIYAKDDAALAETLARAHHSLADLPSIDVVYRLNFSELPGGRNPFGFRDGLHNPSIEGHVGMGEPSSSETLAPGEILMGYPDELGAIANQPIPDALRRNGTFVAVRKYHACVASFRSYLREVARDPADEELIAAKMVGRWRSGAPLTLSPTQDDPALGADQFRNNDFSYHDDEQGLKCPFSAHMRRVNPRDSLEKDLVAVNLHRFIRRGTNYGPALPDGVLTDDGVDRGGVFLFVGAHLERQFEFVQSQWITNGNFIAQGVENDPVVGNPAGDGIFTIPARPTRRRLHGLPQFVIMKGGEYCFMPGIRALQWIADLEPTRTEEPRVVTSSN